MPRGYVGDRIHDSIIEFLVAGDVLERDKDRLVGGQRADMLKRLCERVKVMNLFPTERHVLDSLLTVRPSRTMLGGA